jgi:dolichol-phosphate mannosyltransferase
MKPYAPADPRPAPEAPACRVSIVAPARDEAANVEPLVKAVEEAMRPLGIGFELIIVDDGSGDGTGDLACRLMQERPWLRCLALAGTRPGSGLGQSAALAAGYRAGSGEFVASLDADLQNDPLDVPRLLAELERTGVDLVQGDRSRGRREGVVRRLASFVGRMFRRALLGDRIRDSACTLRVMRRAVAHDLPLELTGLHRFVPFLAGQLGYQVIERPVAHRPRQAGTTKYGWGLSRALPAFVDLLAVRYMAARRREVRWKEIER